MPALPQGNSTFSWDYAPNGSVNYYYQGQLDGTSAPGELVNTGSGFFTVAVATTLPSGYSYTPSGQILTPSGQIVSSFTVGGPTVPFDGGMSIMLLTSGIGYGAKRLKAKKAAKATATV